jgi:hypothetical protein
MRLTRLDQITPDLIEISTNIDFQESFVDF